MVPPQLLEAASIPQDLLLSLLPFSSSPSSSSSSPALSTSEFVRSALQAFDKPFPDKLSTVRGSPTPPPPASTTDPTPRQAPQESGADSGAASDENAQGDAKGAPWGESGALSLAEAALSALQSTGWLPPGLANSKGTESSPPLAPTASGSSTPQAAGGDVGGGSGGWGPLDLRLLLPSAQDQERKEELWRELEVFGFALPDLGANSTSSSGNSNGNSSPGSGASTSASANAASSTGTGAGAAAGAGAGGGEGEGQAQSVASAAADLTLFAFRQTESMLGWLAVLGAASATKDAQGEAAGARGDASGDNSGPAATSAPPAVTADAEGTPGDGMSEEQKQAMRDVFGRAETAVEAWAMLASSLGQQTLVKSEFEKIAFLESEQTDTQVRGSLACVPQYGW